MSYSEQDGQDGEFVDDDYCSGCGLQNCECPPLPKCYDCGGSGITIEGWPCDVCEGTGELDL